MSFEPTNSTTEPSTLGGLPCAARPSRALRPAEFALLDAMLSTLPKAEHFRTELREARVEEMPDGGMGSLCFLHSSPRRMAYELARASYLDQDGVPVKISINVDGEGDLFELDMWKVDFSPLRCFPTPQQVMFERDDRSS